MGDFRLLIDIGSTFTKVLLVDLEREELLGRAQSPSTVNENVLIGLREAKNKIGDRFPSQGIAKDQAIACSSAAGGLRMVCVGFVPELTVEAATRAALGAGAKLVGGYAYELTSIEMEEIVKLLPDIILLAGGTDGGNKNVIIHNARMISKNPQIGCPIIVAGNKSVYDELKEIFGGSGKSALFSKNVMPEIGRLEVDSCREMIKAVFVENIVKSKGIDQAKLLVRATIVPTPVAVLNAARLLSEGYQDEEGLGELILVDVGGATTDVYSLSEGKPTETNVLWKGLPEPYAKRTVEGDLGVRHNIGHLYKIMKKKGLGGGGRFEAMVKAFHSIDRLPENEEEKSLDSLLAEMAVQIATERHAGRKEVLYGPLGAMQTQIGKDLSQIKTVVGTGGPIVFAKNPKTILDAALLDKKNPCILKPEKGTYYIDSHYVLYGMGLLSLDEPKKALRFMKKYLQPAAS